MKIDEEVLYQHIGTTLRQRRRELGLSQAQLAEAVGILRTSITNVEAGRQRVPLHVLYQICAMLKIEVAAVIPPISHVALQSIPMTINIVTSEVPPKTAEIV